MTTSLLPLTNVYFILVRPVYLGNIGSVARLMKNFGFSNLRLVEAPRNYKDAEARKMSVGAFDVLKRCETFASFHDCIKDLNLVVGTSSGQQRSQALLPLKVAGDHIRQASSSDKVGIVFGDERNGLANDELTKCHILTRIPTDPAFPSLNVAQAACIVAYELAAGNSEVATAPNAEQIGMPTVADDDQLFDQIALLLDNVEFSRRFNRSLVLKELRQFYRRAMPTKREHDLLRGVMHKLNQISKPLNDEQS